MPLFEGENELKDKEIVSEKVQKDLSITLRGSTDLEAPDKEEVFEYYMEPNGRIPDEYLLKALELSLGNVTRAAKLINVDRSIYYHRVSEVPGFREKMNEIREIKLDFAESKFFDHVMQGDKQALMFYLSTIGKNRGYTRQMEVVGNEDRPVMVNINVGGADGDDYS